MTLSSSGPVVPVTGPVRDLAEPHYRSAVLDLLGLLAHGELSSFARLAHDAVAAPTLRDRVALSELAVKDFGHYEALAKRIVALGGDPEVLVERSDGLFSEFDRRTQPSDWWEHLTKAYVGYGIANDFCLELADYLDADTRELVAACLGDDSYEQYVVAALTAAIESDSKLAARLALWGRRLVGEALALAQGSIGRFDGVVYLLGLGRSDGTPSRPDKVLGRLTEGHTRRMNRLGLTA